MFMASIPTRRVIIEHRSSKSAPSEKGQLVKCSCYRGWATPYGAVEGTGPICPICKGKGWVRV